MFSRLDEMSIVALAVAVAVLVILFLRWSGQRHVGSSVAGTLIGDGCFDYAVAGSEAHQPVLSRMVGRVSKRCECTAELVCEEDEDGVTTAIWICIEGDRAGHVMPRELPLFEAALKGRSAECEALILRDARSSRHILKLDLTWPPRLR